MPILETEELAEPISEPRGEVPGREKPDRQEQLDEDEEERQAKRLRTDEVYMNQVEKMLAALRRKGDQFPKPGCFSTEAMCECHQQGDQE